MMAKGSLLVLPSKVESTCHGRSIPTEAIPRPIRLAKRALRWPRCSHSAHSQGSGRDSVLEKDIWLYLQHLATLCRFIFSTIEADDQCFVHLLSYQFATPSSEGVSSFESYIETIEMKGVCPTWLRGLGCRRGAHRSERLQHRQPHHEAHTRLHRQPHGLKSTQDQQALDIAARQNATALIPCTDTSGLNGLRTTSTRWIRRQRR